MKKQINNQAFTLIELLVTISIFALVTLMISAVYIGFSRIQARANATQRILNDSQFILEAMAREIRNDLILDYTPAEPANRCTSLLGDNYGNCILLQREGGQVVAFAENTAAKSLYFIFLGNCNDDYTACDWGSDYTDQTQIDESYTIMLNPAHSNIEVISLKFDIKPDTDPFVDNAAENRQPRVTIQLETGYNSEVSDPLERISQLLQTTVSSRVYRK